MNEELDRFYNPPEEEMKRARTALWNEGKVKHTLDRRFDLEDE